MLIRQSTADVADVARFRFDRMQSVQARHCALRGQEYEVFGVDLNPKCVDDVRRLAATRAPSLPAGNFRAKAVEAMSFPNAFAALVE
jgi:hypothetical protein